MKDRKVWLLITSRGYWKKLHQLGFWGFASKDKKRLELVRGGDWAVVYLTADGGRHKSAIGGIVEFIGKPWENKEKKNLFDTIYPWRIKIKVNLIEEPPLAFSPFVGKVSFVSGNTYWGSSLQGQPIKPITMEDFHLLRKTMEKGE